MDERNMKQFFTFRPVISKAKLFFQAMIAASSNNAEGKIAEGVGYGHTVHRKRHAISKHERQKRERIHRLSTRKRS